MKPWWKKAALVAAALLLLFILFYEFDTKNTGIHYEHASSLAGKVIILDPGHGGPDGGSSGQGGVLEKDIALDVANDVRDYLQQAGALVYMTRSSDKDLADEDTEGLSSRKTEDLHKRVHMVEDIDPDLFISLHLNAIPSPRWRGAQTFFDPKYQENEQLGKYIQSSLRHHLENTTRIAKAIDNIYVLKSVEVPSALVEIGFLSNAEERVLLQKNVYQKKMAASIYEGILAYYTKKPAS